MIGIGAFRYRTVCVLLEFFGEREKGREDRERGGGGDLYKCVLLPGRGGEEG